MIAIQNQNLAHSGATVWWRVTGCRHPDLAQAWQAAGLPDDRLPALPSPERRLGRAVRAGCSAASRSAAGTRYREAPIARRGAWQVFAEVTDASASKIPVGLDHRPVARFGLDDGALVLDDQGLAAGQDVAVEVSRAWLDQDGQLAGDDVGLWLTDQIERVHRGVRLRPTGGIYYLPPAQVEALRPVIAVLEAVGAATVYLLPTVQGDEAARAVVDALREDVASKIASYTEQITAGAGRRAIQARMTDCDELLARLGEYDSLLGGALDEIRRSVDVARDACLDAAYALEASQLPDDE